MMIGSLAPCTTIVWNIDLNIGDTLFTIIIHPSCKENKQLYPNIQKWTTSSQIGTYCLPWHGTCEGLANPYGIDSYIILKLYMRTTISCIHFALILLIIWLIHDNNNNVVATSLVLLNNNFQIFSLIGPNNEPWCHIHHDMKKRRLQSSNLIWRCPCNCIKNFT